ncbi:MAG: class I SAM-dependent methyltransferase [Actinomycetota bacterium]
MSDSVGFDRAAEYYDRTRGFSPVAFDALMHVLVGELGDRGRCLEVGVGTGLLALALAQRGVGMIGADIARPMLDELIAKAGGKAPFPLVQADATRLPFRDGSLGSAVFRHVLHLIPGWRGALAELLRAVGRGGKLVIVEGTFHEGTWWDLVSRFLAEAGDAPFGVGLDPREFASAHEELVSLGARGGAVASIPDRSPETMGEFLDQMEAGMHSWTWRTDEAERRRAVDAVRRWATDRYGSLQDPVSPDYRLVVHVYELD